MNQQGPSRVLHLFPERVSENLAIQAHQTRGTMKTVAAPHYVLLMGCGYICVNRYCVVRGEKLDRASGAQRHALNVPSHVNDDKTFDVLRDFLSQLNLRELYSLEFVNPLDHSGQIGIIAILVGIWKFVGQAEFGEAPIEEETVKEIVGEVLRRQQIELVGWEQIFAATCKGSCRAQVPRRELHLDDEDEESMEAVDEKYDLVFVRTDAHPSDFVTSNFVFENTIGNFRDSLKVEDDDEDEHGIMISNLPRQMKSYTISKLMRRGYVMLPMETALGSALFGIDLNENPTTRVVKGYEVQRGGVILALAKGEFYNGVLLNLISETIGRLSDRAITEVKFYLLRFALGASVLSDATLDAFEENLVAKVSMGPEPLSSSDEDVEMDEEEAEQQDDELVCDDTSDEEM